MPSMRAARFYGQRDLRVERIEEPQCRADQVKVAPAFTGICGTDLHEWLGGPKFSPLPDHPHGITGETIPITLGHEFSGTVIDIGSSVSHFNKGDRVVVQPNLYCGSCGACAGGYENVCDDAGFIGLSGGGGGLSDFVCVKEDMCLHLPENIKLEDAALIEPLSVGAHAVSAAGVQGQDNVVILGGGPIGLAVLQALRPRKPSRVIVVELAERRKQFALQFGATHVVDPSKEDTIKRVREICDGKFPDVVFDCAGTPVTLETACKVVKAGGTVCNLAIWEKKVPFDPNWLVFKEAKYVATLGYRRPDYEYVIGAMATGAINPGAMITGKIKLEDVVDKGFKALVENKDLHVKILVDLSA